MADRFVRRLHQFARTVHYIDKDTLERLERTLYDYMTKGLDTCY